MLSWVLKSRRNRNGHWKLIATTVCHSVHIAYAVGKIQLGPHISKVGSSSVDPYLLSSFCTFVANIWIWLPPLLWLIVAVHCAENQGCSERLVNEFERKPDMNLPVRNIPAHVFI
ncbi:hypothetical protein ACJW30_01G134900 [Castanea mollissima]